MDSEAHDHASALGGLMVEGDGDARLFRKEEGPGWLDRITSPNGSMVHRLTGSESAYAVEQSDTSDREEIVLTSDGQMVLPIGNMMRRHGVVSESLRLDAGGANGAHIEPSMAGAGTSRHRQIEISSLASISSPEIQSLTEEEKEDAKVTKDAEVVQQASGSKATTTTTTTTTTNLDLDSLEKCLKEHDCLEDTAEVKSRCRYICCQQIVGMIPQCLLIKGVNPINAEVARAYSAGYLP